MPASLGWRDGLVELRVQSAELRTRADDRPRATRELREHVDATRAAHDQCASPTEVEQCMRGRHGHVRGVSSAHRCRFAFEQLSGIGVRNLDHTRVVEREHLGGSSLSDSRQLRQVDVRTLVLHGTTS